MIEHLIERDVVQLLFERALPQHSEKALPWVGDSS
jgi:hypothetical protein